MAKSISISDGTRTSLRMHHNDNVATILDDATNITRLADGMAIAPGVPFGHKVALADIPQGAPVTKYGVVIGCAIININKGDHVHVHNLQ